MTPVAKATEEKLKVACVLLCGCLPATGSTKHFLGKRKVGKETATAASLVEGTLTIRSKWLAVAIGMQKGGVVAYIRTN